MDELIYYDESVGQKQIDAKQAYPPTKKKKSINSPSLPYSQNKTLFPIICSFLFSTQESCESLWELILFIFSVPRLYT